MKVKILRCELTSWYKDIVGQVIEVDESEIIGHGEGSMYYVIDGGGNKILLKNCEKFNDRKAYPTLKQTYEFF